MRHRADDDDATMRHLTDEDTDRTSLATARGGARWRFWALGVAVVVAVVVTFALAKGVPAAVPTPDATNSTNATGATSATSATTAGHAAPTPAVTNPAEPGAAPSTTTDAPSATKVTPRRSTTPAASTAPAQPKASPSTTTPAPASPAPALNTTAVALLWKKLEARAPGEPCVLSLITRVKFENEPFEKAGADIQRCARTLGIKP
jgi:cytoskeletal protein RodZ